MTEPSTVGSSRVLVAVDHGEDEGTEEGRERGQDGRGRAGGRLHPAGCRVQGVGWAVGVVEGVAVVVWWCWLDCR